MLAKSSHIFNQPTKSTMMILRQKPSVTYQPAHQSTQKARTRRFFHPFGTSAKNEPVAVETIGGVYTTESTKPSVEKGSTKSINTARTESSTTDENTWWISSGLPGHHRGAPLVVRRSFNSRGERVHTNNHGAGPVQLADEDILGQIMLRSRKLPQHSGCFSSNHIMINSERTRRLIPPLARLPKLDDLARNQAALMASARELSHSDPVALQDHLGQQYCLRLAENVTRGPNLRDIHQSMMASSSAADRNNILDRRFTCMGIGTAKAANGTLYLCQMFRG
jgi:hypothetical protein